jgi:hypothetical protein
MWMYLGPYCPNRPFSEELDDVGINTRVEPGVDYAPLGAVSVGADWRTPSQAIMLEVRDMTSWCVALVPICPSSQPEVTWS